MTPDKSNELLIVITTFASLEDAKKMAYQLIESRLAACVQIQGGLHSIYRWEGKVCEGHEVLMSAKTVADKWIDISNFIKSIAPNILTLCPTDETLGQSDEFNIKNLSATVFNTI